MMPSPSSFHRSPLALFLPVVLAVSAAGQQVQYSAAHRHGERALPQTVTGGTSALRARLNAGRSGISLALADFDADGTPDLITGYAIGDAGALTLQRGSVSATAPTAADWATMQRGELVAPFQASAKAFALPVHPDFLKAVDLNGNGTIDVIFAARGDSNIYVLMGDGKGGFAAAQSIPAAGAISALATWRGPGAANYIAAGVCTSSTSCALQLIAADASTLASVPLTAAPSAIEVAPLNTGAYSDFAVVSGGAAVLVDGDSIAANSAHVETLPVSGAASLATGNFVYDRRGFLQLAVLGSDATLHVLVRSGVDNTTATPADVLARRQSMRTGKTQVSPVKLTGTSWTEAETVQNVGSGSAAPLMFRSRLTGGGYDDLAILASGQFITVAHPLAVEGGVGKTIPTVIIDSSASAVTAALPARISPDARYGVITADRSAQPNIALPPTNKTFTVTTTVDGVHSGTTCTAGAACSLRDAVALANADHTTNGLTKVDTITIPAGTYPFTTAYHPANDSGGNIAYHYDLDASMNLVGAGAGSTILNGATLDKIFSGDSGIVNALAPYDVFITNLTLENGKNNNPTTATNFYGGIMDWESFGPGNLTLNGVTIVNGTAPLSPGGGLYTSNSNDANTNASEGLVEIDNSTISSNTSPEQGGGIFLGSGTTALLNTDTFTGNTAVTTGSSDPAKDGSGGALYTYGTQATGLTTISGSIFTGNTATDSGGGAVIYGGAVISNTTFQGNQAGAYGGGLYYIPGIPAASSITSSTFISNSVIGSSGQTYGGVYQVDGGGICSQSYGTSNNSTFGALAIHYSRIHGNTGGNATGLAVGCASAAGQYATVNATDNWWGCDGPGSGTGCDTAIAASPGSQTLTLTPFSTLTLALSSTTPPYGSALTATGSLGQDSAGTIYTTAQNAVIAGLPATLTIVQTGGGTTNSSASTLDTSASIATSANVTIPGPGTANVTVDGTTITAPFTVTAPDLIVTSAHTGAFLPGSTGDTYTIIATNIGTAATAGQVTVVDTLPSGFTATALSGTGWSCNVATLTCTNSTAVAASSSFNPITLTVSVGSGQAASIVSNVVSVSGGNEVNTANDTYTDPTQVNIPPVLTAAFSPTGVPTNTPSALGFTVTIPTGDGSVSGVGFIGTLPTGLKISTPNGLSGTCGGGAISAPAAGTTITLAGATLSGGASCTFSVNTFSAATGSYTATTNAVTSTNAGTGSTASATLAVAAAPTNVLAFGSATIPLNGSTSLSVTIGNPNSFTSLTGLQFSDALAPGLVVATPNALSNTCGGTVTATAGSSAFTLTGGTVAASGSCVVSINITGTTAGSKTSGESVSSTEGGSTASNSPTITVVAPVTVAIAFSPNSILAGANSTLTFTLTSTASVAQTGVAISDTLPNGLVVASPNSFSGSCGGSGSAIAGGTSITLSGGTIAANSLCTLSVAVTGNTAGAYTAITSTVSSTTGGTGTSASANLTVVGAPTIAESFVPSSVAPNANSVITFVITNPNTGSALTGVSFTDTFPTGLKLATPSNLVNTCNGTAVGSNGATAISLTGGGITAGNTCTITANILSTTAGSYPNPTSTVTTTNAGTGAAATATLNVLAPPTVAVGFGANPIPYGGSTTLSFIITNPNTGAGLTGVALTDTLPSGLVIASPNGIVGTCGGGTFSATAGGTAITLSGGTLAAGSNCPLSVNVTGASSGLKSDSAIASATTAGAGAAGTASTTVSLPASKLVFGTAPASPINTGGNAGTVTVQEEDSTSAVVTTATDSILLTVTGPNSYSKTYTVAAVNGVATFNLTTAPLPIAGTYTYTATFSTFTQAQANETVNAGPLAGFTVAGGASFTAPNTADSVVVTAIDAFGNKVTTYTGTIHFTSTDASANLPANYTFTGGDAGVHTFTVFFGTAGTYSLTVTDTITSSSTGSQTGIIVGDSIWLINSNATLDRLTDVGVQSFTSGTAGTVAAHAAIAFDNTGAAWAVTNTSNTVLEYSRTGIGITVSGSAAAGVNAPVSLAIDGLGYVWIANGNNTISEVSSAGAAASPSTGFQGGSLSTPTGIIVDNAGSVWVTNGGNNSVTKFIGAAAPVTTPVVTNTSNNTLATRP